MTMEVPSSQQMQRAASAYRIPPSVFERSKTNSPTDWSVASNESLFSIQGANVSFKNDSFLFRSEDLNALGVAEARSMKMSDQKQMTMMFSCPSSAHPTGKMSIEKGIADAEATMKEVIKESEAAGDQACVTPKKRCHHSHGSNTSVMSYAFSSPTTGDTDKADPSRIPSSTKSRQAEVHKQSDQSQPTTGKEAEVQEQSDQSPPKPEKKAEASEESKLEAETAPSKETPTEAPNRWKWFPCLSCC